MKVTGIDPALCDFIPGLKATPLEISGWPDAVAVACHRTGKPRPSSPGPTLTPMAIPFWLKLREYQKEGVMIVHSIVKSEGGVLLADDMGLGKCAQSLAVWESLGRPAPLLIIGPASVRRTWREQFKKWCPDVTPMLAETGAQIAKATSQTQVIITSYELTAKLPRGVSPQMIILDEIHNLRGRGAQRSLAAFEIGQTARYKLGLTGSPQWSRPRDWWMLLKILFGYRFGSADAFDEAYCGSFINKWGGKENKGATRLDELKLRLQWVMLRRTKAEVASELPPLTRTVRWVKGTKEARTACEANALGNMSLYDALATTLTAKIDTCVEAMVEAGKSLVFTWRKADAHEIAARAEKEGIDVRIITGDETHRRREALVSEAAKVGASVVATIDSVGTGVDGLQFVADTGIFHALDFVPIKLAQAEARLHRIGQIAPVTWVYLAMEHSADQYVVSAIVDKLQSYADVLGADETSRMGNVLTDAEVAASTEAAMAAIREEMANDF